MFARLRNYSLLNNHWMLVSAINERCIAVSSSRSIFSLSWRCLLDGRSSQLPVVKPLPLKCQQLCSCNYVTPTRISSSPAPILKQCAESDSKSVKEGTDLTGSKNVIYVGTLARYVRIVKVFSLSTSVAGICLQPFIYQKVSALPVALAIAVGGFASFFIYLTPILLHLVSKRYVSEMTFNSATGKYTATTYTFLLRKKIHQFTADDVTVPNVPGLFTSLRVHGVPLFIDRDLFTDQCYFVQLFKYADPLDWEIINQQLTPDNDDKEVDRPKKL